MSISQIQIHVNSDSNSPLTQVLFSDTAIGAVIDPIKSGPARLYSVTLLR